MKPCDYSRFCGKRMAHGAWRPPERVQQCGPAFLRPDIEHQLANAHSATGAAADGALCGMFARTAGR